MEDQQQLKSKQELEPSNSEEEREDLPVLSNKEVNSVSPDFQNFGF